MPTIGTSKLKASGRAFYDGSLPSRRYPTQLTIRLDYDGETYDFRMYLVSPSNYTCEPSQNPSGWRLQLYDEELAGTWYLDIEGPSNAWAAQWQVDGAPDLPLNVVFALWVLNSNTGDSMGEPRILTAGGSLLPIGSRP